jgi:hypothetical protein
MMSVHQLKTIPVKPHVAPETQDAQEVEKSLYEARRKIYPRAVTGWYARWRWVMVFLTQALFYVCRG